MWTAKCLSFALKRSLLASTVRVRIVEKCNFNYVHTKAFGLKFEQKILR